MEEETICHLFYYCTHIQDMRNQVQAYFTDRLHFFTVNTTSYHFRFHNIDNETFLIQNHIILLLKSQRFIGRKYRFLSFKNFLNEISKIKNLERRVVVNNRN